MQQVMKSVKSNSLVVRQTQLITFYISGPHPKQLGIIMYNGTLPVTTSRLLHIMHYQWPKIPQLFFDYHADSILHLCSFESP